MLRSCTTQPRFDTPRYAWSPAADVEFAWEPIVAAAEYSYSVVAAPCSPGAQRREVLSARRALEVIREAVERYGSTVRGDDLRRTLEAFEHEQALTTR